MCAYRAPTVKEIAAQMGSFEILQHVGAGSCGRAYLAKESAGPCAGAKWILKEVTLPSDRDVRHKVYREAQVQSKLHHPYICWLRNVRVEKMSSCMLLCTNFCKGGDLKDFLEKLREAGVYLQEPIVLTIMAQLLLAVDHAHSKGIVHRDIKTENVYIDDDVSRGAIQRVMLGDFGVSRTIEQTGQLSVVGTPLTMAPEVMHGEIYGKSCDIWSLGCLLVELCNRKPAFAANSMEELSMLVQLGEFTPLDKRYSRSLGLLAKAMLSVQPERRPTANQLLQTPVLAEYTIMALQNSKLPIDSDYASIVERVALKGTGPAQELHELDVAVEQSLKEQMDRFAPTMKAKLRAAADSKAAGVEKSRLGPTVGYTSVDAAPSSQVRA
ncbi:unnamed protein product [Pedinophyceae sp. YPF-701]|nr:unnamed protein product [Pedinophyceae sp. YPF-701]